MKRYHAVRRRRRVIGVKEEYMSRYTTTQKKAIFVTLIALLLSLMGLLLILVLIHYIDIVSLITLVLGNLSASVAVWDFVERHHHRKEKFRRRK